MSYTSKGPSWPYILVDSATKYSGDARTDEEGGILMARRQRAAFDSVPPLKPTHFNCMQGWGHRD